MYRDVRNVYCIKVYENKLIKQKCQNSIKINKLV